MVTNKVKKKKRRKKVVVVMTTTMKEKENKRFKRRKSLIHSAIEQRAAYMSTEKEVRYATIDKKR